MYIVQYKSVSHTNTGTLVKKAPKELKSQVEFVASRAIVIVIVIGISNVCLQVLHFGLAIKKNGL